jgi:DNA modification methylase
VTPYFEGHGATIYAGDCLTVLPTLPDNSVDCVVTDPPYGLEFMGKDWDAPWQRGTGTGGHDAGFSPGAPAVAGVRGAIKSLPSYTGGTNPTCRNCGGLQRGSDSKKGQKPCRCKAPRFDNVTLPRMLAFQAWCEQWAAECLRILRPGGHLLAFGGTRTWHRLTCAIEDAGFEIRDSIAFMFGAGFPKSANVGRAIDGKFCREAGTHIDGPDHVCPATRRVMSGADMGQR